jgi:VCBS repeat-containing protein
MFILSLARRFGAGLVLMGLLAGVMAGSHGVSASNPPVPQDDHFTVGSGGVLNVAKPGVLANDISGSGFSLQVSDLGAVSNGTVNLNGNGSFSFTPKAGFVGLAFFQYKINDGANDSLRFGTAFINVVAGGPVNVAPVANNDSFTGVKNRPLAFSAPGVLQNDKDANNDKLRAVLVAKPTHGTLILKIDGGFVYTPNTGFVGTDKFAYRANDGAANSNTATVTITIK